VVSPLERQQAAGIPLPRLARLVTAIEDAAMRVVAASLFATMIITVIDVVRRYVFNAPLAWAYDIIGQYLLVAAFFLALSYTLRVDGHMNVDILPLALKSARMRIVLRMVGDVLSLVFFLILLVASTANAWSIWADKEVLSGVIPVPLWICRAFVVAGTAILVLRLLLRLAADVVALMRDPSSIAEAR
jgi:TRAP-type C4-dicarboxylate transport system permease small subunit